MQITDETDHTEHIDEEINENRAYISEEEDEVN